MAKINSRRLPLPEMNQLQAKLWRAFGFLESPEEIESFFTDFFTHTEIKMFAKRFWVAVMLLEGKSYEKIMKKLRVSEGLISSVQNYLQTGASTLETVAQKFVEAKENEPVDMSDWEPPRIGRYAPGDLLSPVVDEASRLIKRKIREKKRSY